MIWWSNGLRFVVLRGGSGGIRSMLWDLERGDYRAIAF